MWACVPAHPPTLRPLLTLPAWCFSWVTHLFWHAGDAQPTTGGLTQAGPLSVEPGSALPSWVLV